MAEKHNRLKYTVAIGIGFLVDLSVAILFSQRMGLALEVAAALGFALALIVNYILFETWVFRTRERMSFSFSRALQTAVAALLALGTRIGVIYALSLPLDGSVYSDLLRLAAGFVASFTLNYALAAIIFRKQ